MKGKFSKSGLKLNKLPKLPLKWNEISVAKRNGPKLQRKKDIFVENYNYENSTIVRI